MMQLFTIYKFQRRPVGTFVACLAIICQAYSPILVARDVTIQAHADIQDTIKRYVSSTFSDTFKTSITIGKLDPRLRLQKCEQALEAFYPTSARKLGATTLGVRCLGPTAWQIYVPVQVKAFGPAVVSKHALIRGTLIQASDLTISVRELSGAIQGYYTSFEQLKGMELRHSLARGNIIGPKSLKPHKLVKRGDIVTILAEMNGLHIQVKGTALMDGFKGQSIRIKNTRSKRVLQGEVIDARIVRINM